MGANAVNRMAEAVASLLASLAGGRPGLRILSNLADRRLVRVRARVPLAALRGEDRSPEEVRDGIVAASRFAARDPYRATTHNKGILNGIDAVAVATGNDWRAVEAGAHAFAASRGTYAPLCTWHREGDDLAGRMELPLAMGTVGGLTDVHPVARISLRILGVRTATELAMAAAAAEWPTTWPPCGPWRPRASSGGTCACTGEDDPRREDEPGSAPEREVAAVDLPSELALRGSGRVQGPPDAPRPSTRSSSGPQKEIRRRPSAPKSTPGTVTTRACSSRYSDNAALSLEKAEKSGRQ
jgi:hypothetical protein